MFMFMHLRESFKTIPKQDEIDPTNYDKAMSGNDVTYIYVCVCVCVCVCVHVHAFEIVFQDNSKGR